MKASFEALSQRSPFCGANHSVPATALAASSPLRALALRSGFSLALGQPQRIVAAGSIATKSASFCCCSPLRGPRLGSARTWRHRTRANASSQARKCTHLAMTSGTQTRDDLLDSASHENRIASGGPIIALTVLALAADLLWRRMMDWKRFAAAAPFFSQGASWTGEFTDQDRSSSGVENDQPMAMTALRKTCFDLLLSEHK